MYRAWLGEREREREGGRERGRERERERERDDERASQAIAPPEEARRGWPLTDSDLAGGAAAAVSAG